MGIAQYNRGSAAISRQIDAERRAVAFEIMDMLNQLPKHADMIPAKAATAVLFVAGNGGFWAVESQEADAFGFWYPSLSDAVKSWPCVITGFDGQFWEGKVSL